MTRAPHWSVLPWTSRERRWRDAVFAAMLPGDAALGMPAYAELDHTAFWATVERTAPPLLQLGLRAATWALTFSPAWLRGTPRTFDALSSDEQDALLQAAASHDTYAVRQLIMMVKTLACLAYFEQPSVRARVEHPGPRS